MCGSLYLLVGTSLCAFKLTYYEVRDWLSKRANIHDTNVIWGLDKHEALGKTFYSSRKGRTLDIYSHIGRFRDKPLIDAYHVCFTLKKQRYNLVPHETPF